MLVWVCWYSCCWEDEVTSPKPNLITFMCFKYIPGTAPGCEEILLEFSPNTIISKERKEVSHYVITLCIIYQLSNPFITNENSEVLTCLLVWVYYFHAIHVCRESGSAHCLNITTQNVYQALVTTSGCFRLSQDQIFWQQTNEIRCHFLIMSLENLIRAAVCFLVWERITCVSWCL